MKTALKWVGGILLVFIVWMIISPPRLAPKKQEQLNWAVSHIKGTMLYVEIYKDNHQDKLPNDITGLSKEYVTSNNQKQYYVVQDTITYKVLNFEKSAYQICAKYPHETYPDNPPSKLNYSDHTTSWSISNGMLCMKAESDGR